MLDKRLEKKIKLYYILLNIKTTLIWCAVLIPMAYIILSFIDDTYLEAKEGYLLAMIVMITLIVIYVFLAIYAARKTANMKKNPDYQEIENKISSVFIDKYDEDDEVSLVDIHKATKASKKRDIDVFKIFKIKEPNITLYILALVFIPLLIMVALYLPRFITHKSLIDQRTEKAAIVVDDLREAFKDDVYQIYYDDPREEYYEYGYYFSAYMDYEMDTYLMVSITEDGIVDYLSYYIDVDPYADTEETLTFIQDELDRYYTLLEKTDLEDKFKVRPELTDAFIEGFREEYGTGDATVTVSLGDSYMAYNAYESEYGDYGTYTYSITNFNY